MNAMILLTAMSAGQLPTGGPPNALPAIPMPGAAVQPMPPPGGMPPGMKDMGMNGNGDKKDEEKKDEEKKDEEKKPEPYALMRALKGTPAGDRLDALGITISGWAEGSYTLSSARRNNLPVTFNDRADFWQFNQNYLKIEKAVDTSKEEFQLGFRTDVIVGTDARFSIAKGFLDGQLKPPGRNGALPNYYPIDVYQMYAEAFLPDLGPKGTSVKVGRFATHCSYELVQGAENPFLSRSYIFQYNPFTHTGVWATSPLDDTWTVSNGLVVGSDNFIGAPNRPTYIGQLKWAPKDGKTNVLLNAVVTDPRYDTNSAFPFYNYYGMTLTHNFTDKLTYVLDTAFSHIDHAPLGGGAVGSATWYGAANYLSYKHTDKLTSTLRGEVFEDTKGFRTGTKGLYTEVTYGLAYAPKPGLIFRPSVRYDNNSTGRPFEGKSDLYTAAMDVIVRY